MIRPRRLLLLVALVLTATILVSAMTKVRKPSIVIIAFDALRADHLSCYGYPKKTTPYIDAFSKEAVLFENAVSPAATTAPSFMSLFTGLMPGVHQIGNFEGVVYPRLSDSVSTFPEMLKKLGYVTACFADTINLSGDMGFGRGFDVYTERSNYGRLQERIEEWSAAVKRSKERGQPLFLFIHTFVAHAPYVYIPYEFNKRFLEEEVKGLPVYYSDVPPPTNFKDNASFYNRFDLSNPRHRKHMIGLYDSAVHYNDHIFRLLRDFLIKERLYDDSFVIVMADHGEEFFEHGGRGHGRLFAEALHVPFIIKFPKGQYASLRIKAYVRTMDLFPTLFQWCAVRFPAMQQGISFMPLINSRGSYQPLVSSEAINGAAVRFIKDGYTYTSSPEAKEEEFLFDVRNDPAERHNLAKARPDLIVAMRRVSDAIARQEKSLVRKLHSESETFVYGDGKVIDELKALGYAQ